MKLVAKIAAIVFGLLAAGATIIVDPAEIEIAVALIGAAIAASALGDIAPI